MSVSIICRQNGFQFVCINGRFSKIQSHIVSLDLEHSHLMIVSSYSFKHTCTWPSNMNKIVHLTICNL